MQNKDELYIDHVIESISRIEDYLSDQDYDEFCFNSVLYDAIVRNLQILAESVQKISKHVKFNHSEILWKDIAGISDILIYDCSDGVDKGAVWSVAVNYLPDLKQKFKTIKSEIRNAKDGERSVM